MIVTADQYFVMLGNLSPPSTTPEDSTRTYSWIPYGPFADQTECVKMIMTQTYVYDEMKIIKCQLPLMLRHDHATVTVDELTSTAVVEELTDEQPDKS